MKIVEFLKKIFKKKTNEEPKICCKTCKFNAEWYCSHPKGNCYDHIEAANRWRPKEDEVGDYE